MRTVAYAVYDVKSGQVVHLHIEPAGLDRSPEEILHFVKAPRGAELKVMQVPGDMPPGPMRVEKGQLQKAKEDAPSAYGGISNLLEGPPAKRAYERKPPR